MEQLRQQERQLLGERMRTVGDVSEKEAAQLLNAIKQLQNDRNETQLALIQNLEGVISNKKILLLLRAEEKFKRRMLQQFRKKRGGR